MNSYELEIKERVRSWYENKVTACLVECGKKFVELSAAEKYSYNFNWLGFPIIQYPQDIVTMQELIFKVNPDLIIETGIARGGSVIFNASMLALLDFIDHASVRDIKQIKKKRKVIAIDIDIREENLKRLKSSPFTSYFELIEGSSISRNVHENVKKSVADYKKVMVFLDSNHTHDHVLKELELYAPFVTKGSYCVVFDTLIEDMANETYPDRDWGPGNNPATAIRSFLMHNHDFVIDEDYSLKNIITANPGGYLLRK